MSTIVGLNQVYDCGSDGAPLPVWLDYADTSTGVVDVIQPIVGGTYRFEVDAFNWIYQVEGYNPSLPMPLWWNMVQVDIYQKALCGVINPTPYGSIDIATPGFVFPAYSPAGGADCTVTPPNPPVDSDMTEQVAAVPGGNMCISFDYELDIMDQPCPVTACTTAMFSIRARKIRNNPRFRIRFNISAGRISLPP